MVVDLPDGPKEIELATRDTPASLKKALEEDAQRRKAREELRADADAEAKRGGLLSSIKRFWGGS